jgi:dihydroxy-acid dehydratase
VFEAVGANAAGKMSDADLLALENVACPGAGACGGQYTANTMSHGDGTDRPLAHGLQRNSGMDPRKDEVAFRCGEVVMNLLKKGIRPSDILTHAAFENAIAGVATTGGSTNAVLHLLAISREMGLPLDIDDFQRVSERTPLLADLKPAENTWPPTWMRPAEFQLDRQAPAGRQACRWLGDDGHRKDICRRSEPGERNSPDRW